ncbi:MAG: DUF5011 domain-containing protein [Akkermansiaceae bacterium]
MKTRRNLFRTLLMASCAPIAAHAADIDVISNSTYSENSFASSNNGIDGGLGTNIRVIKGTNVTWTKDNTYFVTDKLFIPKGATLTIQPGTKIYFSADDNGTPTIKTDDKVGAITACRGGKLIAEGTAAEPIVFSSVREWEALNGVDSPYDADSNIGPMPTSADGGQWGGIVLLGQAFTSFVNNTGVNAGTVQIEGFAPAGSASYDGDSLPDATQYGVSAGFPLNNADNSGIMRYCSIRHGGYEFDTGKEINGLTLGAVGSGTTIEFVEVYANQDDGIEFFGGTVNTKNIVMAFNQDDSFDIDEGYRGINQFWFCIQNPGAADAGGEWDGVGGTSAGFNQGDTATNHANPIIYNATFIGAERNNTLSKLPDTIGSVNWEKGNFALHVEDYFAGEIYNSVFDDYAAGFIKFNDNANSTGTKFKFKNNTIGRFGNVTAGDNLSYITGTGPGASEIFDAFGDPLNGNSDGGVDPSYRAYMRNSDQFLTAIDPRPTADSPLLSSQIQPGAPEAANYRGAFGSVNWAKGWTRLDQDGYFAEVGDNNSGADTIAPVITLNGANPVTLTVGQTFQDLGATVTDNVDAERTIFGEGSVDTTQAGSYTLTYNTLDIAGNAATPVTRNVIISAPLPEIPGSIAFITSIGSPSNIANYFQIGPFSTASVALVGRLPRGMKFNPVTKLITGYPTAAGQASFNVTLPGAAPVPLVMNFTIESVPVALSGSHVLHTDAGDSVTVTVTNKATATLSILSPSAAKPITAKGRVKLDATESDPNKQWTLELPAQAVSIALPTTRTFKEGDSSYLGNYGTLAGEPLWGFKSSGTTGEIVLSKASAQVRISGVRGAAGSIRWTITPAVGKAIRATNRVSADGIAGIRVNIPGSGLLVGMLRVDEALDNEGQPTGQLNVSLLQGFDGWDSVSYTAQ